MRLAIILLFNLFLEDVISADVPAVLLRTSLQTLYLFFPTRAPNLRCCHLMALQDYEHRAFACVLPIYFCYQC